MKKKNLRSPILLFFAAVIWGIAFVAQSVGMEYIGPFTFSAVRSVMGGFVLLPVIVLFDSGRKASERKDFERKASKRKNSETRTLLAGGICCGICLCVASNLQQIGIQYTTVGKAGFITAMYIVLVPLFGIFLRKRISRQVWISVALAVLGLYLLCMTEALSLGRGDAYVLLCAFVFALHILVIDYFSPKVDGIKMSCIQFFVCGLLSSIPMFFIERPAWSAICNAWLPLAYAGVMSSGVAYTLQIVGQKDMDPTIASLILSMESVVSVLSGWVILHQHMSMRELIGCVVMFAAIILAQMPEKEKT